VDAVGSAAVEVCYGLCVFEGSLEMVVCIVVMFSLGGGPEQATVEDGGSWRLSLVAEVEVHQ
jgi:hypothetical protein